MKKKTLAILCLLLAGVVVAYAGDVGKLSLQMQDNFEYGVTYQGTVNNRNLVGGQQIKTGETYDLKVTFTASRDLEDKLMFCLVDQTERAKYWTQLTETTDIYPDRIIKKGETVTFQIKVKTIAQATGTQAQANTLVFMTEGQGTRGRKGSGVLKGFTLEFTELVLTKE